MRFRVTSVTDGDTFKVSPNWNWQGETGNIVRPLGYDTPEIGQPGYAAVTEKLRNLILGKDVELKNAVKITYGRLLCSVYLNGVNIASYFSQYQRA